MSEVYSSAPELTYQTRDWNGENVVHIYPNSFKDNHPEDDKYAGYGSLSGITEKLDFLKDTGATCLWLGPIFESPGRDGNYDTQDYYKINEKLGTLDDFKQLIDEAHKRDIRIMLDMVFNHVSEEHEWFKAATDPDHPDHHKYFDYFIWKDAVDGELPENIVGEDRLEGLPDGKTVPNNWTSIFSTPQIDKVKEEHDGEVSDGVEVPAVTAWVWHPVIRKFYLADFGKFQPDLNWENEAVQNEMLQVERFWLDLGADGFRFDVINHLGKDPEFRDEKLATTAEEGGRYKNGETNPHDRWEQERMVSYWDTLKPRVLKIMSVLNEPDYASRNIRFILEDWMSALSSDDKLTELQPELANVFNFAELLQTNRQDWRAVQHQDLNNKYYTHMETLDGSVPNQVTGNHDTASLRKRLGSLLTARAATIMLGSMPGAWFIWQGDLLLQPDAIIPKELQRDGDIGGRDGVRLPLRWDSSKNGGFSQADPSKLWLPTFDKEYYDEQYPTADNFELQMRDPLSPYRLIKSLFAQRRRDAALHSGAYVPLHADNIEVVSFARLDPQDTRRQVITLVNFTQNTTDVYVPDVGMSRGSVVLSSTRGHERGDRLVDFSKPVRLAPDEAVLVQSVS